MGENEFSMCERYRKRTSAYYINPRSIISNYFYFCAGHRDDGTDFSSGKNQGNFHALLQFRVEAGDEVLMEHLKTCPKNATYCSKTTQNDLIVCCRDDILSQISRQVEKSKFFSVLADEASDSSNKEQLAIILRYVDESGTIVEKFVGFVHAAEGVTGEALTADILSHLSDMGIDMKYCRGQCYDGAGAMAGTVRGVAARISGDYPDAQYTHCASHRLNLAVVQACQVPQIRNVMGTIKEAAMFFNFSPKRQKVLEDKIDEVAPPTKAQKLVDLCRTRWVARIDAMEVFVDLIEAILSALSAIKTNDNRTWDQENITRAGGLYHNIARFEFLVNVHVCLTGLGYTKGLTVGLQSSSADIYTAYGYIDAVKATIKAARENAKSTHKKIYAAAVKVAEQLDIPVEKPRTCGRQQHRANQHSQSVRAYFRASATIPFLDHLSMEMEQRFPGDRARDVSAGFVLIPSVLRKTKSWKKSAKQFVLAFEKDLPDIRSCEAEFNIWEEVWLNKSEEDLPATVQATLASCTEQQFPVLHMALRLLGTFPITTCQCERSISALRRLKTYMRSTMAEDRLQGLSLLHIHYDLDVPVEGIIDRFARKQPRRMELQNGLLS